MTDLYPAEKLDLRNQEWQISTAVILLPATL